MTKPNASAAVAGCFTGLIAIPLGGILNGYAFAVLWGWFIVPVFHLPEIGIVQASGIGLVVGMLTHQDTPRDKDREWWEGSLILVLKPLMALLFGAIWKAFL